MSVGMGGAVAGVEERTKPLGAERVKYLRKVYGLLFAAMAVAMAAGWVIISGLFGYTEPIYCYANDMACMSGDKAGSALPKLVAMFFDNPIIMSSRAG
jgi:hypothetical protein